MKSIDTLKKVIGFDTFKGFPELSEKDGIENKSRDLPAIDIELLAKKLYRQIYDGVKTSQLDELTGELCASLMTDIPEYGILGSRIIISNNHKNTSPSFSEVIYILWSNKDINGNNAPLIHDEIYRVIIKNKEKLNSVIDYSRDYNFDYFGFKTLEKSYLRINLKN